MHVFFYFNVLLVLSVFSYVNSIQIETPQGNITGATRKTFNREIYEFLGIPYAKPPTGELRFKNPVPFGSWNGVKNATRDGSPCLQYNFFGYPGVPPIFGSEDCLYLNVYTPSVVEPKKYPVMVFIHGGGFSVGFGSSNVYGPDLILDKDVVMVVMNYRLGVLGFASTEDAEMSGNWGLKDQTLALKWIQDNIASYGGDPSSVTIFGQSAGSTSVHYHTISPLSKGLFHRAIAMSGSAHCPWCKKWPGEIAKRTKMLASSLECPTNSSRLLVECLRKVSPERFIQLNTNIREKYKNGGLIIFLPVVEQSGTDGAFITEDPYTLTSSVPMIIGMTKNEGSFLIQLLQINRTLENGLSLIDEDFEKVVSQMLGYDNEGQDTTLMMKEIRKFYYEEKKINLTVIQETINMFTDGWFLQCTTSAVRRHKGPGYLYLFTFKGSQSLTNSMPRNREVDYGVTHGDDLFYVFPFRRNSYLNMTENDVQMIDDMVSLWTNFAIYGNPTPENGSRVIWNQVSASDMNYLNINTANMTMIKNLLPERDNFWQQFQPKSSANSINLVSYASIIVLIFRYFVH